jgi:hypothetical protein
MVLMIVNKFFGNVITFKYMGMIVTNQNCIAGKIKGRLNLENACYYSVQNLLPSCFHSKNLEIKIHKSIILPVLYGCESWSLT